MSQTSVLKPGLLVSLKSMIRGGISYTRRELSEETTTDGAEVSEWETIRRIENAKEHSRAVKVRGQCVALIRRQCSKTSFGLLCPKDNEPDLDSATREARKLAGEFNRNSEHSRIYVYVLKGRIADNDEEATRALASEVNDMLDQMEQGIRDLSPAAIREAANKAKQLGAMLDESDAERVSAAVAQARSAARSIVKRAGEDGGRVLLDINTDLIESARFSWLDTETPQDEDVESMPAVDAQRFADAALDGEAIESAVFTPEFPEDDDSEPEDGVGDENQTPPEPQDPPLSEDERIGESEPQTGRDWIDEETEEDTVDSILGEIDFGGEL